MGVPFREMSAVLTLLINPGPRAQIFRLLGSLTIVFRLSKTVIVPLLVAPLLIDSELSFNWIATLLAAPG